MKGSKYKSGFDPIYQKSDTQARKVKIALELHSMTNTIDSEKSYQSKKKNKKI